MRTEQYIDQLKSFDSDHATPRVDVHDRAAELVHRAERRLSRRRTMMSLAVAASVAVSCWWVTSGKPKTPNQVLQMATLQMLNEEIQRQEQRLVALQELWDEYDQTLLLRTDYREYVNAQIEHQLAPAMAARTLLHDATSDLASPKTGRLQLIVEHFGGTTEATEAARLLAADPL